MHLCVQVLLACLPACLLAKCRDWQSSLPVAGWPSLMRQAVTEWGVYICTATALTMDPGAPNIARCGIISWCPQFCSKTNVIKDTMWLTAGQHAMHCMAV